MLKKTITFKDLDGGDITDDFYFALSTAEISELMISYPDMMTFFEKVAAMKPDATELPVTGAEIMRVFKTFIEKSVGQRSEDGRRFIKNEDVRNDFMQTDAYSVLFMDLCMDSSKAAEFINGIVPTNFAEIVANLEKQREANDTQNASLPEVTQPAWFTEGRVPTEDEIRGLQDPALLQEAFRRKTAQPQ